MLLTGIEGPGLKRASVHSAGNRYPFQRLPLLSKQEVGIWVHSELRKVKAMSKGSGTPP